MKKSLILLFLFFSLSITKGQNIQIKGTIFNENTGYAIAGAHIYTDDYKYGSVSNATGEFKVNIPPKYNKKHLYFSQIGFEKDSVLIAEANRSVSVSLVPKAYELKEIYVIPDSTLLTLLRKAYNRIPENYPTEPTLYEGFYRESTQNNDKEQVDFIEAHLSIYKDPYDKPSGDPGKVELLKSRKRKIRNTGILYYGGPFLPIRKDVVLQREKFINPRHFRKYNYEFNGIRVSGNQEFYDIAFSTAVQDSTYTSGVMLIEKESLAYVSFDLKSRTKSTHPRVDRQASYARISYEKVSDKWYFKSFTSEIEDAFRFSDKRIYGKVDYLTTRIQTDSVAPIPFERQLQILEPFVLKAEEYDPEGWTDYSLLNNTNESVPAFQFSVVEAKEIFKGELSLEEKKTKAILRLASVLNRTYMDIGVTYNPVRLTVVRHHFRFHPEQSIAPFQIDHNQAKETQYPLLYSSIGYRLNKNISIVYESSADYFNKTISTTQYRFGLAFSKNLTNTGRLLFIEGSLMGTLRNDYVKLGEYDNPTPFRIAGKKIDSDKLSLWYGTQEQTITPQIALKQRTSRFFSLKLFVAYSIGINRKDVFRIKEEKGDLFSKKTATISATDPALTFDNDYGMPWSSLKIPAWQAGIALVFN